MSERPKTSDQGRPKFVPGSVTGGVSGTRRKAKELLPENFAERIMGQAWIQARSKDSSPIQNRPWRSRKHQSRAFLLDTLKRRLRKIATS